MKCEGARWPPRSFAGQLSHDTTPPCGRTRTGQAVVVMPMNWQQPRTGVPPLWERRPRRDGAVETSRQSGRGRPSYNTAPSRRFSGGGTFTALGRKERSPCRSTRKGQAVVVMPMNWQQPRTGALAAIFGRWNLHGNRAGGDPPTARWHPNGGNHQSARPIRRAADWRRCNAPGPRGLRHDAGRDRKTRSARFARPAGVPLPP